MTGVAEFVLSQFAERALGAIGKAFQTRTKRKQLLRTVAERLLKDVKWSPLVVETTRKRLSEQASQFVEARSLDHLRELVVEALEGSGLNSQEKAMAFDILLRAICALDTSPVLSDLNVDLYLGQKKILTINQVAIEQERRLREQPVTEAQQVLERAVRNSGIRGVTVRAGANSGIELDGPFTMNITSTGLAAEKLKQALEAVKRGEEATLNFDQSDDFQIVTTPNMEKLFGISGGGPSQLHLKPAPFVKELMIEARHEGKSRTASFTAELVPGTQTLTFRLKGNASVQATFVINYEEGKANFSHTLNPFLERGTHPDQIHLLRFLLLSMQPGAEWYWHEEDTSIGNVTPADREIAEMTRMRADIEFLLDYLAVSRALQSRGMKALPTQLPRHMFREEQDRIQAIGRVLREPAHPLYMQYRASAPGRVFGAEHADATSGWARTGFVLSVEDTPYATAELTFAPDAVQIEHDPPSEESGRTELATYRLEGPVYEVILKPFLEEDFADVPSRGDEGI